MKRCKSKYFDIYKSTISKIVKDNKNLFEKVKHQIKKAQINHVCNWVRQCKESFSKEFMIVVGYSHRGKLNIRREDSKSKSILKCTKKIFLNQFTQKISQIFMEMINTNCLFTQLVHICWTKHPVTHLNQQ